MIINEHKFQILKSARYYTLGEQTARIKNIWMVFHGYGELAKSFIQKFGVLIDAESLIIAPEAHNKFYLRGISENVGATWMTKVDRENEVKDYTNMIDEVFLQCTNNLELSKVKINVLGFSQGGSTAIRWLAKKNYSVNNLFLWGSGVPRDVKYEANIEYWNSVNIKLIIGDKDRYINNSRLEEEINYLKSQNIKYELDLYEGIHAIDEKTLNKIHKRLI